MVDEERMTAAVLWTLQLWLLQTPSWLCGEAKEMADGKGCAVGAFLSPGRWMVTQRPNCPKGGFS